MPEGPTGIAWRSLTPRRSQSIATVSRGPRLPVFPGYLLQRVDIQRLPSQDPLQAPVLTLKLTRHGPNSGSHARIGTKTSAPLSEEVK